MAVTFKNNSRNHFEVRQDFVEVLYDVLYH